MATKPVQIDINSTVWTAITTAGQNGSCWLDEDNDDAAGTVDCRIVHSDSGIPAEGATIGKRVYIPSGNDDVLVLSANNGSDIFYARCMNEGDTAKISIDAV